MSEEERKLYYYLSEILLDPDAAKAPQEIAPCIAWEGRVTLFSAREKAGKSTLIGAATSAVSAGAPFLGLPTVAGTVLWLSFEEHIAEISRRFLTFGADPERVVIANAFQTPQQDIPDIIAQVKPVLIVWDTLTAAANTVFGMAPESGNGAGWTQVMQWICAQGRDVNAASIILHHANKHNGKYRDSTAIGANVDVILEMSGDGEAPRKLKGVGRWMIPETKVLLKNGTFMRLTTESLKNQVLAFISQNKGCSWRELRGGVSARDEDVKQARDELLKEGVVVNEGTEGSHAYHARIVRAVPGSHPHSRTREPPP